MTLITVPRYPCYNSAIMSITPGGLSDLFSKRELKIKGASIKYIHVHVKENTHKE